MNIFVVKKDNEKMYETVSFARAVEYCKDIDKQFGEGTASVWKVNTNDLSHTSVRMSVRTSIHDNSIKTN